MNRLSDEVSCDHAYLVDFAKSTAAKDLDKVELVELAASMLPLLDQVSGGCTPGWIASHVVATHDSARLDGERAALILLV